MRRSFPFKQIALRLLAGCCAALAATCGIAADQPQQAPKVSGELAVTGIGVTPDDRGWYVRDFGAVDPISRRAVTQDFTIRNSSGHAIVITAMEPSCRCTSAEIRPSGPQASEAAAASPLPFDLDSGATATVRMTVDLDESAPGSYEKTIWLNGPASDSHGSPDAIAILAIRFEIGPPKSFPPPSTGSATTSVSGVRASPPIAAFGVVAPDRAGVQTIELTGPASELAGASATASSSRIAVELGAARNHSGSAIPPTASSIGTTPVTRVLIVRLNPSQATGPLSESVAVHLAGGSSVMIPVIGRVVPVPTAPH